MIVIRGKRLGLITVSPELLAKVFGYEGQVLDVFQLDHDKKTGAFTLKVTSDDLPIVLEGQQIPYVDGKS
jgi:hypothetical protein